MRGGIDQTMAWLIAFLMAGFAFGFIIFGIVSFGEHELAHEAKMYSGEELAPENQPADTHEGGDGEVIRADEPDHSETKAEPSDPYAFKKKKQLPGAIRVS